MLQLLRHLGRLLGEALAQGRSRCSSGTLLQKRPLKCQEVAQLHTQGGVACRWKTTEEEYSILYLSFSALSGCHINFAEETVSTPACTPIQNSFARLLKFQSDNARKQRWAVRTMVSCRSSVQWNDRG